MPTFLLSYPGTTWRIIGGGNPRSQQRPQTSPKKALAEWIQLADTIVALGAEVAVLSPLEVEPPLSGLIYTANAGHLFTGPRRFRLSQMTAAHRREEAEVLEGFLAQLGIPTEHAEHPWEGQAEITSDKQHALLTWGSRSAPESVEEVSESLPRNTRTLSVQIRPPFYHGDTCLGLFQNTKGRTVLMVYLGGLITVNRAALESFLGPEVEVFLIQEPDALLYACNSVCINGTLLVPRGLSAELLAGLRLRDFVINELSLDELFGKGGGGPRALVNNLGEVQVPAELRYQAMRAKIIG